MNILRKLHQRLTGTLGYDVDGKPLRAGDEVLILSRQSIRTEARGLVCSITGATDAGELMLDLPHPLGKQWVCFGTALRRIDTPDSASWDQITESTGWKPSVSTPSKEDVMATQLEESARYWGIKRRGPDQFSRLQSRTKKST